MYHLAFPSLKGNILVTIFSEAIDTGTSFRCTLIWPMNTLRNLKLRHCKGSISVADLLPVIVAVGIENGDVQTSS